MNMLLAASNYRTIRGYIIFDRIDIHCEIQPVPFAQLTQMQPGEPSALQCADDGEDAASVCRTRCRQPQHAPHGNGTAEALCPRLQPHPKGRPHHRRP